MGTFLGEERVLASAKKRRGYLGKGTWWSISRYKKEGAMNEEWNVPRVHCMISESLVHINRAAVCVCMVVCFYV